MRAPAALRGPLQRAGAAATGAGGIGSWVRDPLSPSFFEARVAPRASEADVQPERPIGRRRRRLEVADHAGGAFEIVRLRVEAREGGALPIAAGVGGAGLSRGP